MIQFQPLSLNLNLLSLMIINQNQRKNLKNLSLRNLKRIQNQTLYLILQDKIVIHQYMNMMRNLMRLNLKKSQFLNQRTTLFLIQKLMMNQRKNLLKKKLLPRKKRRRKLKYQVVMMKDVKLLKQVSNSLILLEHTFIIKNQKHHQQLPIKLILIQYGETLLKMILKMMSELKQYPNTVLEFGHTLDLMEILEKYSIRRIHYILEQLKLMEPKDLQH